LNDLHKLGEQALTCPSQTCIRFTILCMEAMRPPWVTSSGFPLNPVLLTNRAPPVALDTPFTCRVIRLRQPTRLDCRLFQVFPSGPPHTSSRQCTTCQLYTSATRRVRDFHPLVRSADKRTNA